MLSREHFGMIGSYHFDAFPILWGTILLQHYSACLFVTAHTPCTIRMTQNFAGQKFCSINAHATKISPNLISPTAQIAHLGSSRWSFRMNTPRWRSSERSSPEVWKRNGVTWNRVMYSWIPHLPSHLGGCCWWRASVSSAWLKKCPWPVRCGCDEERFSGSPSSQQIFKFVHSVYDSFCTVWQAILQWLTTTSTRDTG